MNTLNVAHPGVGTIAGVCHGPAVGPVTQPAGPTFENMSTDRMAELVAYYDWFTRHCRIGGRMPVLPQHAELRDELRRRQEVAA